MEQKYLLRIVKGIYDNVNLVKYIFHQLIQKHREALGSKYDYKNENLIYNKVRNISTATFKTCIKIS